jgi:hypothetical protein
MTATSQTSGNALMNGSRKGRGVSRAGLTARRRAGPLHASAQDPAIDAEVSDGARSVDFDVQTKTSMAMVPSLYLALRSKSLGSDAIPIFCLTVSTRSSG